MTSGSILRAARLARSPIGGRPLDAVLSVGIELDRWSDLSSEIDVVPISQRFRETRLTLKETRRRPQSLKITIMVFWVVQAAQVAQRPRNIAKLTFY
jgi:hypothetical protein